MVLVSGFQTRPGLRGCALAAAALTLAGCGGPSPKDTMNQLKPGLWRTQTTTDIHRTGQKPQKLKTSTAFVCVAPETRPAGLRLAIRLGCTGSVNIDGERGIWSFTEICAREPFSQGDGVVWGDFRRGYVIERDLMTADPANPAVARNVHEVVNGRWVRADCPKDAGK